MCYLEKAREYWKERENESRKQLMELPVFALVRGTELPCPFPGACAAALCDGRRC